MQGAFELGLKLLDAPVLLRQMHLEAADERARTCLAEMGKGEREKASQLVDLWERNSLIQLNIRYEEEKQGIGAVNHLLPKWHAAGDEVRRAEDEAMELGPAAFGYYQSRQEGFRIQQWDRDETGQYKDIPDYSELRRQWYAREPITEPLPWPWNQMLALCKRFEDRSPSTWERLAERRFDVVVASITILLGVIAIVLTIALN